VLFLTSGAAHSEERTVHAKGIERAYNMEFGFRTMGCLDPINTKIWFDIITGSKRKQLIGTKLVTTMRSYAQVMRDVGDFITLYGQRRRYDLGIPFPDCSSASPGQNFVVRAEKQWYGIDMVALGSKVVNTEAWFATADVEPSPKLNFPVATQILQGTP
jgi:hypothetical protein